MPSRAGSNTNSFLTSAAKANKDARLRGAEGANQRNESRVLLTANDLSGDYDFTRALMTTLGGQLRVIDKEDLKVFRANIQALKKLYKGGATAKQLIDTSAVNRRQKAQAEIRMASPIMAKNGRVRFQTNSGKDSKVMRHYVDVDIMGFAAALSSPLTPLKAAADLQKSKIKVECSCEDWRYRYRFLASISGYAAGPWIESAFTKITNPKLQGSCCKHVLRVAAVVGQSPTFRNYLANLITQARKKAINEAAGERIADMREFTEALKKESYRQRKVATTTEKQIARMGAAAFAEKKAAIEKKAQAQKKQLNKQLNERAKRIRAGAATVEAQLIKVRAALKQLKLSDAAIEAAVEAERKAILGARTK